MTNSMTEAPPDSAFARSVREFFANYQPPPYRAGEFPPLRYADDDPRMIAARALDTGLDVAEARGLIPTLEQVERWTQERNENEDRMEAAVMAAGRVED